MKRIVLITILITLFTTILSAQPQQQKMDKRAKILVVILDAKDGKTSWFKQSIIDSLAVSYKVDTIQAKKPADLIANGYKSIIVMDQLKAWMMGNGKLKKFTKVMDPKHTVYFVTSGDKNWKWKKKGITAITSASTPAKIPEIVKNLRLKIEGN